MRLVLDGKSLLAGSFAGASLVATFGAAQNAPPQVGRFQIDAESDPSRGTTAYVVDTATGQVWREHKQASAEAVKFAEPKLGAVSE